MGAGRVLRTRAGRSAVMLQLGDSVPNVWARAHGADRWHLLAIGFAWVASALLCHVGLPQLTRLGGPESRELQLAGMVALSVTAGMTSLLSHDHLAWMAGPAPRRQFGPRAVWLLLVLVGTLAVALLSAPLLPAGLALWNGFLAVGLLWWSLAFFGVVLAGRMAGMLLPLGLAFLASSKIIPWQWNVIFNPNLTEFRLIAAVCSVIVVTVLFAVLGSAADRRNR